jgi:hypothetical protein
MAMIEAASLPMVEGAIPGEPIRLSLLPPDGGGLALILDPASAVAVAELLEAVRLRTGRQSWPERTRLDPDNTTPLSEPRNCLADPPAKVPT